MGTPNYMSPEQARGEKLDLRSDIFSLGVVFYELLTGQLPFKGDNYLAVLYDIIHHEPPPLQAHRPGISPGLQKIMDQALCKDLHARYQRMEGFLADLNKENELFVASTQPATTPAAALPSVPPQAPSPGTGFGKSECRSFWRSY